MSKSKDSWSIGTVFSVCESPPNRCVAHWTDWNPVVQSPTIRFNRDFSLPSTLFSAMLSIKSLVLDKSVFQTYNWFSINIVQTLVISIAVYPPGLWWIPLHCNVFKRSVCKCFFLLVWVCWLKKQNNQGEF